MRSIAALVVLASISSGAALAQGTSAGRSSSPSYELPQSTVNGGGRTSSSPSGQSYRLTGSVGQEAAIGTSSAPHYVLQSGFWSFLGSGLVPVLLTAVKGSVDPDDVALTWTGNNSPYQVYRSDDPSAVLDGWLVTEPSNAYTDAPPPGVTWYYSVLATAPGPFRHGTPRVTRGVPASPTSDGPGGEVAEPLAWH